MSPLTDSKRYSEEINTHGYTVVPNVISAELAVKAKTALDRIFTREKIIAPELDSAMHQVSFCIAHKERIFRSICQIPETLQLARSVLGNDCTLSVFNGISMKPHGDEQQLHIDQQGPAGEVELLNMLFPLDDFTRGNGCTRLIPGSHKLVHAVGTTADHRSTQFKHLEDQAIYMEIPVGSAIVYNGLIVHAGSRNRTDHPRRALIVSYCRQWIQPQWDFVKGMPRHILADFTEEERMLFGYYAEKPLIYDHKTAYVYSPSPFRKNLERVRRKADKLFSLFLR